MTIKKIIILLLLFIIIFSLTAKVNKPLIDAIIQGDLQKVEKIIERGTEVNFIDSNGYSPLIYAVIHNNKEILDVLLKAKADVNATNTNGYSALYYAVYNNRMNTGIIESLVNNEVDINIKINNKSILMYSIDLNNKELFDILLKTKADVDTQSADGDTPLIYAVKYNKKEFVEALVKSKADINTKGRSGNSALYYAFNNDDPEIIKLLINNGADINISISGYSPLIFALYHSKSKKEIIEVLINAKADVNAADNEGRTPLMWALIQKDKDTIKVLLDEKANVNAIDKKGNYVLTYALDKERWSDEDVDIVGIIMNSNFNSKYINNIKVNGYSVLGWMFTICYYWNYSRIEVVRTVIELLLKNGANVNENTSFFSSHSTPLIEACKKADLETVKLLLKYGADVNITEEWSSSNALHFVDNIEIARLLIDKGINIHKVNENGETPLFNATGNPEILSELIKRKAKVNIKNKDGKSPLMCAGKKESVKILINAGADINEKMDFYNTILVYTIIWESNNIDKIKLMIDRGAKLEHMGMALENTANHGDIEVFNFLLDNYKINSRELGQALFGIIVSNKIITSNNLNNIKNLLEKGADPNLYFSSEDLSGRSTTPLLTLVRKDNINIDAVKLLLDYGAEIDAKLVNMGLFGIGAENVGDNALDLARKNGNRELIDLLEKGNIWNDVVKGNIENVKEYCKTKNINIHKAFSRENLLFHAIHNGQVEMARILIDSGIDINIVNAPYEKTVLHIVTDEAYLFHQLNIKGISNYKTTDNNEIVKLLINAKVKLSTINAQDIYQNTALRFAVLNNNYNIVKLLVEAKADVNIKDENGNTPYSLAYARGFKEIETLLLKYGAKKSEHKKEGGK